MTDQKLSALTAIGTEPSGTDEFYLNDGGTSKKILWSTIKAVFATAAQGAKADTALQSADINTLAELNAILGDATLGDSGDFVDVATYDPAGIAEQLVGLSAAQSLRNKTINSSDNNVYADSVHIAVRNESGVELPVGAVVYTSGYSVGQDVILVDLADASSASTMPALGVVETAIPNNATGVVVGYGRVSGLDTSSFSAGDEVYASETAGELTNAKPTGSALIQKLGTVLRSHVSLGVIEVGTDRVSDIPNTMLDTVVRIVDEGDATKQIAFQASGISTGQTRTVTMPDRDVDLGKATTESLIVAVSDETTDLETGTAKLTFRMPYGFTLSGIRSSVSTAPVGADIKVSIHESGSPILDSNGLTIDAGEKTSTTSAVPASIIDASLADDAEITIDIDQIGSGTAGAGLKIAFIGQQS